MKALSGYSPSVWVGWFSNVSKFNSHILTSPESGVGPGNMHFLQPQADADVAGWVTTL
jgi:hypothetical protein